MRNFDPRLERKLVFQSRQFWTVILSTLVGIAGCRGPTAETGGGSAGQGGADQESGVLVATPAIVSFDDAVVGFSYEMTVRLANAGDRDATIVRVIAFGIVDFDAWSADIPETPMRLAPGESVELSLFYSPTVSGGSSGKVWIETETSIEDVLRLSGRATLPPTAQVTEKLDFGAVGPGEVRTQSVVVRNVGTGVLKVTGVSLSGNQFTLHELETPGELGPFEESGLQFEIPISFTPSIPNGGHDDFGTVTVQLEGGLKPSIAVELRGRCTDVIEPPRP